MLSPVCRSSTRFYPFWTASDGATDAWACLRVTRPSVGSRVRGVSRVASLGSDRRWAASVDRSIDASVTAEHIAGALCAASIVRRTLRARSVGGIWRWKFDCWFFGWAGHVAASSASDAGVPRLLVGILMSVACVFQPSELLIAIFVYGLINRSGGRPWHWLSTLEPWWLVLVCLGAL
jgi:hypothetical protein